MNSKARSLVGIACIAIASCSDGSLGGDARTYSSIGDKIVVPYSGSREDSREFLQVSFGARKPIRLADLGEKIVAPYANPMADPMDLLRLRFGQTRQDGGKEFSIFRDDRPDAQATTRYETPLTVGPLVYRSLLWAHRNGDLQLRDAALAELRVLLAEFDRNGYWQRKAHPPLGEGWWSGMDLAVVALATQLAFEVTGDSAWARVRDRLAAKIIAPVASKGSRIMLAGDDHRGKCWYLEYVWEGASKDNVFFVMNGSLFTLQALRLLADASGSGEYRKWFDCGVRGYLDKADQFYYPDDRWSFYQLKPQPVIVEPHYMIIEIGLLDSLYFVTGNEGFKGHADRRRAILARNFPVVFKRNEDGSKDFVFSRFGGSAPLLHRYLQEHLVLFRLGWSFAQFS